MYASTSPLFKGAQTVAKDRAMDRLIFSNLIHIALRGYGSYMWSASMAVDPYFESRALALLEKLNTASVGYVRDKGREILEKASLYAVHNNPKALLERLTSEETDVLRQVHILATELDATQLASAVSIFHSHRVRGSH